LLRFVTDVFVHTVFVASLLFVVTYARARFWRTAWGRWLMADTVVIMLLSGLGVIAIHWGPAWAGRDIVRAVAWGLIAAVMVWRLLLRRSADREARADARDKHSPQGHTQGEEAR
jgi:hypothetical protein